MLRCQSCSMESEERLRDWERRGQRAGEELDGGCSEGCEDRERKTDLIFDNWHLLFFVRFECSFESTLLLAPSSLVK